MVTVGLLVRLEAKPGKEADVESFLKGGLAIVNEEPDTTAWFAIRMGPTTYGIFDVFPTERRPAGASAGPRRGGTHGPGGRPLQRGPGHRSHRRAGGEAARLIDRSGHQVAGDLRKSSAPGQRHRHRQLVPKQLHDPLNAC